MHGRVFIMLDRGDQDALTCALRDSLYYATVYESYNLCYGVVCGREKQPGKIKRLMGKRGFMTGSLPYAQSFYMECLGWR